MKPIRLLLYTTLLLIFSQTSQLFSKVEIVQRRFVTQENINEFIERETKYWSKVAKQAIDEGKMDSWSLWQRVDGLEMDREFNFMFINTFAKETDLDNMDEIWRPEKLFPNLKAEQIDTMALSTVKDVLFYDQLAFSKKKDPKYIRVNYAKAESVQDYVDVELEEWFPFVQERMDSDKTNVVSWELSQLVAPRGKDIPFEAISVDGFETLSDALFTYYGPDVPFPNMDRLSEVHHKAEVHVYELILAVNKD